MPSAANLSRSPLQETTKTNKENERYASDEKIQMDINTLAKYFQSYR